MNGKRSAMLCLTHFFLQEKTTLLYLYLTLAYASGPLPICHSMKFIYFVSLLVIILHRAGDWKVIALSLCKTGLCYSFIFISHHFRSRGIINSIKGTIVTLGRFLFNFNLGLCYHNLRIDAQCL